MRILLILAALLSLDSTAVTIRTNRNVLYAGTTLLVDCLVVRRAENRRVVALLPGYTSSERQLEGESAPRIHHFTFTHIPCEVVDARCILIDAYDRQTVAIQPLQIADCDPH